ncbi:MAG: DegT/DnrJ/EryC1/StrS family aminotransferase [Candidatus Omnitrophica bacterium]|nr:DegT/DnrJ/EryC1/StrS family aminotransferase [Candidatus Omnitrophota bacterium]
MKDIKEKTEGKIADYFDKKHALITGRACSGLWLYLKAKGYKDNFIILPNNICTVVPYTVSLSGNKPYFVDIEDSGLIDLKLLDRLKLNKVAAVLGSHLYGNILDYQKLLRICRARNWDVIEDVAQAMGANYRGKIAGSLADCTITSFGIGKHIDLGYGGMVAVNDGLVFEKMTRFQKDLPSYDLETFKSKLDSFKRLLAVNPYFYKWNDSEKDICYEALFFSLKAEDDYYLNLEKGLTHLKKENQLRAKKAELFSKHLRNNALKPMLFHNDATYWRFNILVKGRRDELLQHLKEKRIKATKYFEAADKYFSLDTENKFPVSYRQEKEILNLWVGKETSLKDAEEISLIINSYFESVLK